MSNMIQNRFMVASLLALWKLVSMLKTLCQKYCFVVFISVKNYETWSYAQWFFANPWALQLYLVCHCVHCDIKVLVFSVNISQTLL